MKRWFVSTRVMLLGGIRLMLGRNSSAEISLSGAYMGRSMRG